MCGIAGFIDPDRLLADHREALSLMSEAIRSRGPDGEGRLLDDAMGIGLAHRRLSIFDPSDRGSQPMTSATGRFTIVFNGAIYNHPELRTELEGLGHAFRGGSDTEVMLAAFEQWGLPHSLDRFNGMFAFALVDTAERMLHLVRDRIGQKPLLFATAGSVIAFSSDLRGLEALPDPMRTRLADINPIALDWYLAHGAVPWPLSIREGVEQVSPGGRVSFALSNGAVERTAWWSPPAPNPDPHSNDSTPEALDRLESALDRSVELRLRADQPVGILLSGGLDSRLIAGFAAQHAPGTPTFTLGLPGAFDESREAEAIAGQLGLPHRTIHADEASLLAVVRQLPELCDEPFADSSLLATTLLARGVRDDVAVALGGDGGDELLGGYRRHRAAHAGGGALDTLLGCMAGLPRSLTGRIRVGRLSLAEAAQRQRLGHARPIDYLGLRATQGDAQSLHVRPRELHAAKAWLQAMNSATPPWDGVMPSNPGVREIMQLDLRTYLPDDPLVKVDRSAMSVALEARAPFLDSNVVNAALALPDSAIFQGGLGRAPTRRFLAAMGLPVTAAKKGFAVPLFKWLRGPLREWADTLMREDPGDPLDQAMVEDTWRMLLNGRRDLAVRTWTVICWRAWLQSRSRS